MSIKTIIHSISQRGKSAVLTIQDGDIVLVEGEMGDAVGIVDMTGEQVAIPARKGLISFPMIAIRKAWRVG